jgi:hypothetical protein
MPFLDGPVQFTGKLDMLSAYPMRGCSKIVVRRKGGPSPDQIKRGVNFANTRHTMSEFGGCSRMGKHVRMTMTAVRRLSDNNFGSDINSIMRQVQLQDGVSQKGQRNIYLSEHARILEGFPLNKENPTFDAVIRNPVYYTLDRATRSAHVDIPELKRGINYFPQNNHALFRIIVTLGIAPDLHFSAADKEYLPPEWFEQGYATLSAATEWFPSLEGMDTTKLSLRIADVPPEEGWTLILSIGIEYGMLRVGGKIEEVPNAGAAKIMALRGKESLPAGEGETPHEDTAEEALSTEPYNAAAPVEPPQPAIATVAPHDERVYLPPAVTYVYVAKEQPASAQPSTPKTYTYVYPYTGLEQSATPVTTPDHDPVHHLERRPTDLHHTRNRVAPALVWADVGGGFCTQSAGNVLYLSAGKPSTQGCGFTDDVSPGRHNRGRPPGALPVL